MISKWILCEQGYKKGKCASLKKGYVYLLWVLLSDFWCVKPALKGLVYLDLMTHVGLWISFTNQRVLFDPAK